MEHKTRKMAQALFLFPWHRRRNVLARGKKMVTGVQVVTAFQMQIIGCRWQAISFFPYVTDGVCVDVTALGNMKSDLLWCKAL